MDNSIIAKYRVRKFLRVFSLSLLFIFLGLIIWGYVRIIPKDIEFTNVTSSSFTVSWSTRFPTKGTAIVIESKNKLPIGVSVLGDNLSYDTRDIRNEELASRNETSQNVADRDSIGVQISDFVTETIASEKGTYYTHHVEVKGLNADSEYSVMVGDGLFFFNSQNFTDEKKINTTAVPEDVVTPYPAYGLVKDSEKKDLPIDQLKLVTDGIVYFTLIEEDSEERSSTFSSPLSTSGAWYVDLSSAVDSEGNRFLDRLETDISNILGEIVLNAGPSGTWKKTVSINEISPAETIVLNISNVSQDASNPSSLIRIDSLNTLPEGTIQQTSAAGSCVWIGFCTCGERVDNKWVDCACDPQSTYEARGCNKQENKSASKVVQELGCTENCGCANGGKKGDRVQYGGVCKECGYSREGYWDTVPGATCSDTSGVVYTPGSVEEEEETPVEPSPEEETPPVTPQQDGKDGVKQEITLTNDYMLTRCYDKDGCKCIYSDAGREEEVNYGGDCSTYQDGNGWSKATPVKSISSPSQCNIDENEYENCLCTKQNSQGETVVITIKDGESCQDDPRVSPVPTPNQQTPTPTPSPTPQNTTTPTSTPTPDGDSTPTPPTSTPTPPGSQVIRNLFVKKAYAEDEKLSYSEYIVDQSTSSINLVNAGEYIFTQDNKTYLLNVDSTEIQNGTVKVYIDSNSNDKYDEEIDKKISELASVINIAQISQNYKYEFKSGYNFVTFPFLATDINQRTAYGMLSYLNKSLNNIFYSVGKYDGNWRIVGENGGTFEGNDFQLVPGTGYIVKAKSSGSITLSGYPIVFNTETKNAPITLYTGWNLVGTYGTEVRQYTAKSLIQSINSYEPVDFTADNVSRWESDVQRYDGLQITNQNGLDIEYGFDFPINTLQSYFVRILQGKGNWQPELKQ
jgi:hypothetical protein